MKALRIPEVSQKTGYAKVTIWAKVRSNEFPKPFKLGPRATAWLESDIDAWIEQRAAASRPDAAVAG